MNKELTLEQKSNLVFKVVQDLKEDIQEATGMVLNTPANDIEAIVLLTRALGCFLNAVSEAADMSLESKLDMVSEIKKEITNLAFAEIPTSK